MEVYTEAQASKMKVPELKEALKARGLATSGTKPALIARLIAGQGDAAPAKGATKRKRKDDSEDEDEDDDDGEQAAKKDEDSRPAKKGKAKKASSDDEDEDDAKEEASGGGGGGGGIVEALVDDGWKELLSSEFEKPYFKKILQFVEGEKKKTMVHPPDHEVLNAFNYTPFDQVKVVIIGQDPYMRQGQAHGVCFSVKKGVKIPPSLKTIYNELSTDIKGFKAPNHGYLEKWARQGVLMINATLTVNEGKANSHEKCGWQTFTDRVLALVNEKKEGVVFLLWGGFAIKKAKDVNKKRHHVLEAAHPSPLAGGKFLGCKHFSKCNELLEQMGKEPIDWTLGP